MPRRCPLEIEDGPESLTFDGILEPSDPDASVEDQEIRLDGENCSIIVLVQQTEI